MNISNWIIVRIPFRLDFEDRRLRGYRSPDRSDASSGISASGALDVGPCSVCRYSHTSSVESRRSTPGNDSNASRTQSFHHSDGDSYPAPWSGYTRSQISLSRSSPSHRRRPNTARTTFRSSSLSDSCSRAYLTLLCDSSSPSKTARPSSVVPSTVGVPVYRHS